MTQKVSELGHSQNMGWDDALWERLAAGVIGGPSLDLTGSIEAASFGTTLAAQIVAVVSFVVDNHNSASFGVHGITSVGAGVTTAATQADGRNALGLGTAATAATASLLDRANHTGTQPSSSVLFAATKRLTGRNTAAAGVGEEVTADQVLDWIGTAAAGDLVYRGASAYARLAKGSTNGALLYMDTTGSAPVWSTKWTLNSSGTLTGATGTLLGSSTPALSISQTWSNAATTFVGIDVNIDRTTSHANSRLMKFSDGAFEMTYIDKNGGIYSNYGVIQTASYLNSTAGQLYLQNAAALIGMGNPIDTYVYRDAAYKVGIRNGTNAHTLRIYNTESTSLANYERGVLDWTTSSNVFQVGTEKAGTGVARALRLIVNGGAVADFASDNKWMILGTGLYNTLADTSSSANIIVAIAQSGYPNAIVGTQSLRGIFSGYDQIIDANIASNSWGSHHSVIEDSTGGHTAIFGGAAHRAIRANNTTQFAGMVLGQDCTVGGPAAVTVGSRLCTSLGVDCGIYSSKVSSIGLILGTGVATTSTIANPVVGSVITLSSTASFGSVNDIVTVVMDSVSVAGNVIKVPFTCTIASSTTLTVRSNVPTLWDNKPNITNGALVYPTYDTSVLGAQQAVIASNDSHIRTQGGGQIGNVIIGSNGSVIANGTDNAVGTLYPGYSLVMGNGCSSNAPVQFVRGVYAKGLNSGQDVRAYGRWANSGDRQVSLGMWADTTVNTATPTNINIPYALDGSLGQNYVLKPSTAYKITAEVLAIQTAGTGGAGANAASYDVTALITTSSAGAVTIKYQTTTPLYEDQAGWDVTITKVDAATAGGAYATNNQGILRFQVTGDGARTVRWFVDAKFVESAFV